jgi:DNA repair protein RadC
MKVSDRIAQYGVSTCSDLELLSSLIPAKTAEKLLRDYGTLRGVFNNATQIRLRCTLELGRRYLAEAVRGREALKDPAAVRRLLQARLRDLPNERFCALMLDNQHRVISFETLSEGTIDGASVYPREVIRAALRVGAAAVIFAHNHPSGVAEPSAADRTLTERLKAALAQVDIRVLDHFVVGEQVVSFAERGWI